jgi:ankyrin repeat protein
VGNAHPTVLLFVFMPIFYIEKPIFDAITIDDRLTAKILIDRGCSLKWQDDDDHNESSPLLYAAELGRLEILKLMLESKTRFSKDLLTNALIDSCQNGHLSIVELIVKKGAQISSYASGYHTSLTAAVQGNHIAIVKLLVEAGAKVDQLNGGGIYPLLMAAVCGHKEIFDYLEPLTLSVSKRKEARGKLLAKLAERNPFMTA